MDNTLIKREYTDNFKTHLIFIPILSLLSIVAYHITFQWMYDRYMVSDSYYSHGFLVPFVSAFLIWQKRDFLKSLPQQKNWTGLIIIVFALSLHILGIALYIFSVSGFSIFFFIIGLSLFFAGKEITKSIIFPLLFLIFMFPLPQAIISSFSFPLKILAAKAGVWIVRMFDVPVHGEGFNIFIPAGHLLVGNPCSGLRSIIAFLALGSVFAYMTPMSKWRKIFLFLLTIPIALLSNIVRVPILILVSHYWGLEAAAPDTIVHTGSGMLVFIIGFILLLTFSKVLR